MSSLLESHLEDFALRLLQDQGWSYRSVDDLSGERADLADPVLSGRLRTAVDRLNPAIPADARDHAVRRVLSLSGQGLVERNEVFHRLLVDGVGVEYRQDDRTVGDRVRLVDWDNPLSNDLVVTNQYTVSGDRSHRRPDVVLLVNGLPLVVIELKNAGGEHASVEDAFTQLQNYKASVPRLFEYNAALIASNGLDARVGSLTADWSRFLAWKAVDGVREEWATVPQIETMVRGMLRPDVLLDLVRHFTVFEKRRREDPETKQTSVEIVKKIAAYHQYQAVNKAVESTRTATAEGGDRKAGIVWHTQGSGKSLSMAFYAGKLVLGLDNPTIVVITDRNDLDDQLFDTFAGCKDLLRQDPVQAENREHLKSLLRTGGGGVVFTTIQKFAPDGDAEKFDLLSDRRNVIVIADEAHRSQYGFKGKVVAGEEGAVLKYGFAKYLRDALPNASFIGFTGTPIESSDVSTPAVFGSYVDVYDIRQAVNDGATVPIFYESRLVKVHLNDDERSDLDASIDAVGEREELETMEKTKSKWARVEAIVGHRERIRDIAADFVRHYDARQEVSEGKVMLVAMSRRIAVELYDAILALRPEWAGKTPDEAAIRIVMTLDSRKDPMEWQKHFTTKEERKTLAERFKNPADPFKIVIVRDMWLTGFDAPCLGTLYVDKPMAGHNLMQAIARVNRTYKDKPAGLVVDYVGIAADLKDAVETYTQSGGQGTPTSDYSDAVAKTVEKYETAARMAGVDAVERYGRENFRGKLFLILEAQDRILQLQNGKERFTKEVAAMSQAFSLVSSDERLIRYREGIAFLQTVKARLSKFAALGARTRAELDTAIRQIVDRAIGSDGVIDIFDAAGMKKPDISILSDDFLEEVRGMDRKNTALELLKNVLNDEISARTKRNHIQSKKFSEMLAGAVRRYQNNLLTTAQVIDELINIAKDVRRSDDRKRDLGLTDYEIAFYDALADNDSASAILGNDVLRGLAQVLVERVRANTSIDWTLKESAQARLRVIVKRTLREYGYPPDMAALATENVLKQAALLAQEWDLGL